MVYLLDATRARRLVVHVPCAEVAGIRLRVWDGCEDATTLNCSDFPGVICLYDTHLLATSYEKLALCHCSLNIP